MTVKERIINHKPETKTFHIVDLGGNHYEGNVEEVEKFAKKYPELFGREVDEDMVNEHWHNEIFMNVRYYKSPKFEPEEYKDNTDYSYLDYSCNKQNY